MRVISYNRISSDYTTLHKIYSSLILPKIDYASFLYNNAADTHKAKLNRIQYAAARIILGALRCTANYKLEVEANLMPLEFRRKKLLLQYGSRITCIQSHPIREFICNYTPVHMYLSSKYKLSALELLQKDFHLTSSSINSIAEIEMKNYYTTKTYNIFTTLADTQKDQRSDDQWKQLYRNMIDCKYKDRQCIYTDGAYSQGMSG